ncbi:hypothetical protein [Microbacterium album]|uniref:Antitoxin Xre/MbcA/ParS-like toxin-binding domain-containing protein n=1 Tax=Microbacterium album TaxID=2053191 RepID=A0A917MNX9_9MICO|nr:hypothetical protein [Microbacterium album]GGH44044.1 hypothetical protein GCM10010921_18430 [Microbacterium album]
MAIAPLDAQHKRSQERAAESITNELRKRLLDLVDHGVQLTALGNPEAVAGALVDKLPVAVNPWRDVVGPCYTSGALQREINRGRGAVSKAVHELRALRLVTADHQTVYPAFQVHGGALVPGLRDVLLALREGIDDPWTWAQWLNASRPAQDDTVPRRHIDDLIDGDVDRVVAAARQTAAAWAA